MVPSDHAMNEMLPHLLRLIQVDRDYAAEAIRRYFQMCPWAEPLIGPQLRSAWRSHATPSAE